MGHWDRAAWVRTRRKTRDEALLAFRDRFALPLSDEDVRELRFHKPSEDSRRCVTCARAASISAAACRRVRGRRPGSRCNTDRLPSHAGRFRRTGGIDDHGVRACALAAAERRHHRQTHVPIVADEAAHLRHAVAVPAGRDYSSQGQLYEPEDRDELLYYRRRATGRYSRKASTKRARCPRGSLRRLRTARTACRCCPSTFSIPCSASSAW